MRLASYSLLLVMLATLVGACGGEEPGGFTTGRNSKPKDAGDDEKPSKTKDAGSDPEAGNGGSSGSSEAGEGGEGGSSAGTGGSAGSSGSGGSGGTGGTGGTTDPGPVPVDVPESPANPWIAFTTLDSSNFGQLWFVKADGTGLAEYSGTDTFYENDPSWSFDGKKLAFTGLNATSMKTELHILDFANGSDTVLDTGLVLQSRPRWSADGSKLVVAGAVTGNKSALHLVDAESGDTVAMTTPADGDGGHDVSPDGRVYFVRKLSGSAYDVFSVPLTAEPSTTATRITEGSNVLGGVAVHPDATKLLYARKAGMSTELVELTMAGGAERKVGVMGDEQADYFAGGDGIVANRDSFDADSEIAVADKDGKLVKQCTDDPASNTSPAISSAESSVVDISSLVK